MRLMLVAALAAVSALHAQTDPSWKKLQFLVGKWVGVAGEKDTPLGAGQGAFSFDLELNQKIMVRHNNASYDSGVTHDDLLVIYLEGDAPKAIYWDSEGHTIRYTVTVPSANRVVFESESAPGPKYRLSYWVEGAGLNGKFELAMPGAEYKPYMQWTSKKE